MDAHSPTHDPSQLPDDASKSAKLPVARGARACTVCRAAKMKCIGGEDGEGKCQRCKRTGVECVFEKHRRGRKPGSKLSEASKMLRKIEKGLNTQKKSTARPDDGAAHPDGRDSPGDPDYRSSADGFASASSSTLFANNELPPLTRAPGSDSGRPVMDVDEDEDEDGRAGPAGVHPAKLIRRENQNQRHSFFSTILNPESQQQREQQLPPVNGVQHHYEPALSKAPAPSATQELLDPVDAGVIDLKMAKSMIDMSMIRLNPFINLFDPALHSAQYIRQRSPFLFTVLLMSACKFFKPEFYTKIKQMANEMALRAFAEGWKSVEVVQAFACLTYWKEPDDNRTWTYIGYACRMAVELGLNRYVPDSPPGETELQHRERRNRERTYLVLFVHDRSLSTQTGRNWMLPVCQFVSNAATWHERGGAPIRPEDVVVAAFVQLRQIAANATEWFSVHKQGAGTATSHSDTQFDMMLRTTNSNLSQWMDTWSLEMRRAGGHSFHIAFISFFRNYVKLFLNSFGIQMSTAGPNLQAFSQCYTSAMETLQIVVKDFASMSVLRYSQDSITVMTAYAAVFLLKLLRSSNTLSELHEDATNAIYGIITRTADAYEDAPILPGHAMQQNTHARFLRSLVANDMAKVRAQSTEGRHHERLDASASMQPGMIPAQGGPAGQAMHSYGGPQQIPSPPTSSAGYAPTVQTTAHGFQSFGAAPTPGPTASGFVGTMTPHHAGKITGYYAAPPAAVVAPTSSSSEQDASYWRNMFQQLGFGTDEFDGGGGCVAPMPMPDDGIRGIPPHPGLLTAAGVPPPQAPHHTQMVPGHHAQSVPAYAHEPPSTQYTRTASGFMSFHAAPQAHTGYGH